MFVNTYNKTDVASPFGGFKQSGFGKDLGERTGAASNCNAVQSDVLSLCVMYRKEKEEIEFWLKSISGTNPNRVNREKNQGELKFCSVALTLRLLPTGQEALNEYLKTKAVTIEY